MLLAGAMGGGDAVARAGIGATASGCPDQGRCDQRLTAPAQPALLQAALRIDGKAVAGAGGGLASLSGGISAPGYQHVAIRATAGTESPPPKAATGPGQPRGPPAGP